jgi:murein DD-endopeptidase MepM/ murein hydrolase activator NlpD
MRAEEAKAFADAVEAELEQPLWMRLPVQVSVAFVFGILITLAVYVMGGLFTRAVGIVEDLTPHEEYVRTLRETGLADRALGQAWLGAAEGAFATPLVAALPHRESGYFPADTASAVAWRIRGLRGQRMRTQLRVESGGPIELFLDLFEADADETPPWKHVESADSSGVIEYEFEEDGQFLLRLQPELLKAARWTLTVEALPVLGFPVEGRTRRAIQSFFGAARDGGRRSHHGVDIFAPRGTPAVAAVEGTVRDVGSNRLGGLVVWLADEARGQNYYYAHLDTQLVRRGQRVRPGDTLGLVGNTGNARTTPPHLHFGIYRRGEGPIDPLGWIVGPDEEPPASLPNSAPLDWAGRIAGARAPLLASPGARDERLLELERNDVVQVLGGTAAWLRVLAPSGAVGYVRRAEVEPVVQPLDLRRLESGVALRDRPAAGGLRRDSLPAGTTVEVLGRFGTWLYARPPVGAPGWMPS